MVVECVGQNQELKATPAVLDKNEVNVIEIRAVPVPVPVAEVFKDPSREAMFDNDLIPEFRSNKYDPCKYYSCPWNLCCFAIDKKCTACANYICGFGCERPNQNHNKNLLVCCDGCRYYDCLCDCDFCVTDFRKCKMRKRENSVLGECLTWFCTCQCCGCCCGSIIECIREQCLHFLDAKKR
jgi:hypothetical protein